MTAPDTPSPADFGELRRIAEAANAGVRWKLEHRCSGQGPGDDETCGLGWDWVYPHCPEEPRLRGVFSRWADAEFTMTFDPAGVLMLLDALDAALVAVAQERDEQ